MKSLKILGLALAFAGASSAFATTITFEDAPANTGSDLGSFYSGVTFGSYVQVVTSIPTLYPPHSGVNVITDSAQFDPLLSFAFTTPQSSVSFWYTTLGSAVINAYDSNGNLLTTFSAASNIGTNTLYALNDATKDIASISIDASAGAGGIGVGGFLTVDDLSFGGTATVPEAGNTLALLGLAGLGLLACRKHVVA